MLEEVTASEVEETQETQPAAESTQPAAESTQPAAESTQPAAEEKPVNKFLQLLGSRKFWAALIGLALVVVKAYQPDFPLDGEQLTGIIYVLVAYILGTAIEDGGRALKNGANS